MKFETIYISENKRIPNSNLPVILYSSIFQEGKEDYGEDFFELFEKNGWGNSWRNGVYSFHHYHAKAHEVLGCASGWVKVQLGGVKGDVFELKKGKAVLLPAGTGHKRVEASADFSIIGAYPHNQSPDLNKEDSEKYAENKESIQKVRNPEKDPVTGEEGPAVKEWK